MAGSHILFPKIIPPKLSSRMLIRPRILNFLLDAQNYRLTLIQAGAGYGKSTALAALSAQHHPTLWYQVSEEDSDPIVFLLHLCHTLQYSFPEIQGLPTTILEGWENTAGSPNLNLFVDQIINALNQSLQSPTLFIVDDAHHILHNEEIARLLDRIISLSPHDLHILLSGRAVFQLPNLFRWKARGEVLSLDQGFLAFQPDEIHTLFTQKYEFDLTPEEVNALYLATEGWAIALQLIWQNIRNGSVNSIEEALNQQRNSQDGLFEVLTHEIFSQLPPDIQEFLLSTSILRILTPSACDALWAGKNSLSMLSYLRRQELFVVDLADGSLRYHNIFQKFLRKLLREKDRGTQWRQLHLRAADYFQAQGDYESGLFHTLQAEDYVSAAQILESYGANLIKSGRLDTLAFYLDSFPAEILIKFPMITFFHGELARHRSRFEEALGWYAQAEELWRIKGIPSEISRALRGQIRVYLDTVNPTKAEEILQRALRISDGTEDRESQSRLLELLAENKLNAGKLDEAEKLRKQAESLRQENPSDSQLVYRVLLRTGKLGELRQILESRAETERHQPPLAPRAHRETLFLLSLLYSFQGESELAYQTALEGTKRGEEMDSPFVTAVGYMRQGHALQLLPGDDRMLLAQEKFTRAVEISQLLSVPRLRVEAHWGLCRSYGYHGNLTRAQELALEGIEIAEQAGDEWVASLTRTAMGASLFLAGRQEAAIEWLNRSLRGFDECSDVFGMTAARLWLALGYLKQGNEEQIELLIPRILADARQMGYDFLFLKRTLVGPPDHRILAPLLMLARERGWEASYAAQLLDQAGLAHLTSHPGYQLRIQTFGDFQVWRGLQVIPATGWRREKTRQLLQLLITYIESPLDKEQIFEHLWPNLPASAAQRNFKAALNALYSVLEPERTPGSESAFIMRQGSIYGLRPGADLWVDCLDFKQRLNRIEQMGGTNPDLLIKELEAAINLFKGEFLPEARYENWAAGEREYLAVHALRASDRLASLYLQAGWYQPAIDRCQWILNHDNCWERAYRYMMLAYDGLGDRGQIARTYQLCLASLRKELDVGPSPETEQLYQKLTNQDQSKPK
jgi:LuxR family transcriptional regulator, maltose regulon positive regulatory protein